MPSEEWSRQVESMVRRDHAEIRRLVEWRKSTPDAETLRAMEHVFKELPATDDIKRAVTHAKISEGRWEKVVDSFLNHAGKLIWLAIGLAIMAWLKAGGMK